ncbi:hypothetical protein GQR58_000960 [Nymphon striatum]|nr:hypothetical protein GQR58_000960 [Nymphon striatum]
MRSITHIEVHVTDAGVKSGSKRQSKGRILTSETSNEIKDAFCMHFIIYSLSFPLWQQQIKVVIPLNIELSLNYAVLWHDSKQDNRAIADVRSQLADRFAGAPPEGRVIKKSREQIASGNILINIKIVTVETVE